MRTPRKLTALVLMGALAVTSIAAVPASAKTFNDVSEKHWAYKVIDEISDKEIMVGVGDNNFSPESKLTRAEYTAILCNLAPDKSNGTDAKAELNDVEEDAWYADVAEWGVTNGIIEEKDGNFLPEKAASRELMANMTYLFIHKYYPDSINFENIEADYYDIQLVSTRFQPAVNILTNNGLLAGRGNDMFEPQGTLTRAEAAAMASRLIALAEEQDTEDPNDPEQPPVEDPDEEQPVDPGDDPSEEPENPPAEDPSDEPTEDPDQPSVDDPDKEEPSDPGNDDPDENQPQWSLDGAPDWFLVGQPDNINDTQWEQLITYYDDKENPENSNYPSSLEELPEAYRTNEELAKKYCGARMERLYDLMQRDLADQALAVDGYDSLTEEEQSMVDMVNNARRAAGVPELKVSKALCEAADIRAEEANQVYDHVRPDGSKIETVLNDVNLGEFSNHIVIGENLKGYYGDSEHKTQETFNAFMSSDRHKKNMLNEKYEYFGVGYRSNGSDSSWIQLFAYVQ